jgi:hypothetical protein
MNVAEKVASKLAFDFLRRGEFAASSGPIEIPGLNQKFLKAAASDDADLGASFDDFAGLAVQSVGFEEGTEDPKVHIYLTRGSTKLMNSLPKVVEGVKVVAHKMGAISVHPDSAASSTNRGAIFERNSRVCCGTSCGPTSETSSGTFGAIVKKAGSSDLFIFSNNHVLSGCNHVPIHQPILAPSAADGRPNARAPGEIGRHSDLVELRTGDPNFVSPCVLDVALATATHPGSISSWQGDQALGYDTPVSSVSPTSGMRVKKFGRTTHLSFGTIESRVTTPTAITYAAKHFKGVVWFKDIWAVMSDSGHPFALGGDSGSLVVTEDGKNAVGVLFAANRTGDYGWIIPMNQVLSAFGGLTLVGNHHV